MVQNNKQKRQDSNKKVGSGVGVVPEDNIARALDPFGGAAGAISEEETKNKAEET